MKQTVYLVYVLIEFSSESTTDAHLVFSSLEKAKESIANEIAEARENFNIDGGTFLTDTEFYQEWCNDYGQSFSIGIEEIEVL